MATTRVPFFRKKAILSPLRPLNPLPPCPVLCAKLAEGAVVVLYNRNLVPALSALPSSRDLQSPPQRRHFGLLFFFSFTASPFLFRSIGERGEVGVFSPFV